MQERLVSREGTSYFRLVRGWRWRWGRALQFRFTHYTYINMPCVPQIGVKRKFE